MESVFATQAVAVRPKMSVQPGRGAFPLQEPAKTRFVHDGAADAWHLQACEELQHSARVRGLLGGTHANQLFGAPTLLADGRRARLHTAHFSVLAGQEHAAPHLRAKLLAACLRDVGADVVDIEVGDWAEVWGFTCSVRVSVTFARPV